MKPDESQKVCFFCKRGTEVTPLIPLEYRGNQLWICPQHMPVLIHDPGRLVGTLPGAENLSPADPEH